MFNFFSPHRKIRDEARNWLDLAGRVANFRRDLLTAAQNQQLATATGKLRDQVKANAAPEELRAAIKSLEAVLRTTGGTIYPVSSIVENVEFFLVAAIVILGLRAYFVQPFKIPTNSMWPTYYGMTGESFAPGEEPGLLRKAGRFVTQLAVNHSVTAPVDGDVYFPVVVDKNGDLGFGVSSRPGRSFFVFPTTILDFTFSVDGHLLTLSTPADFDGHLHWLKEAFFAGQPGDFQSNLYDAYQRATQTQRLSTSVMTLQAGDRRWEAQVQWVPLGRHVRRGEKVVSFDILSGDLLFVDRVSYNFIPPRVGSAFVFRTDNIDTPGMKTRTGEQVRAYYIKRLVGQGGDKLEVHPPELWRNGRPITGAAAFEHNAHRDGLYPGYVAQGTLGAGESVTVPDRHFFAMGDNSPDSKDSRFFGPVPESEVVGRPLFIYYPFTSRWGPAH